MDEDDFIHQAVRQYRFWDKNDLGRLSNAMLDKTSRYGGFLGLGSRNAEEEYARRNPAFYKQQKQMIDDINNGVAKAFGIERIDDGIEIGTNPVSAQAHDILRNPDDVRNYFKDRKAGYSAGDAATNALIRRYAYQNGMSGAKIIQEINQNPKLRSNLIWHLRQDKTSGIKTFMKKNKWGN